jgi:hypothetical protein
MYFHVSKNVKNKDYDTLIFENQHNNSASQQASYRIGFSYNPFTWQILQQIIFGKVNDFGGR